MVLRGLCVIFFLEKHFWSKGFYSCKMIPTPIVWLQSLVTRVNFFPSG